METTVNLPFLAQGPAGPMHLEATLTRARFNELTAHLVNATKGPVQQALQDAGLSPRELSRVLLVGGSTRIPAVQDAVRNLTGKEPARDINPDECVAMGACLQGGVLTGAINSLVLIDVTPLSLGIETLGDVFAKIIDRNTPLPCQHSQVFTTAANFQTSVEINVLQGEREVASANKSLGKFRLTGIRRALRGIPQIEVTFSIDTNGIVHVTAKDLGTNRAQDITISGSGNMSREDIDRAVREAVDVLREDFTCICPDSRGHGSSAPATELHYEDMADDMIALMEALDLRDAVFCGFSDGGIIGLLAAPRCGRISALITCGANLTPKGVKSGMRLLFRVLYLLKKDPLVVNGRKFPSRLRMVANASFRNPVEDKLINPDGDEVQNEPVDPESLESDREILERQAGEAFRKYLLDRWTTVFDVADRVALCCAFFEYVLSDPFVENLVSIAKSALNSRKAKRVSEVFSLLKGKGFEFDTVRMLFCGLGQQILKAIAIIDMNTRDDACVKLVRHFEKKRTSAGK